MTGKARFDLALAAWLSIAFLLAALSWHSWYTPDIWTHLFLGKQILATGSPQPPDRLLLQQPSYLNVYWLFQIVVWGAYRWGGVALVTVLFGFLWFLTFRLWGRSARAFEAGGAGALLALACVLVCQVRFEERPETVSWLLLALQLSVWTRWRAGRDDPDAVAPLPSRAWAILAGSQVLWANVHGYFVLGPAIAGLRLAAFLATTRGAWNAHRRARRDLVASVVVLAACSMVSPFGARTWLWAWNLRRVAGELRFAIEELGPPLGPYLSLWTIRLFWGLVALTAIAIVAVLRSRRNEAFAVLLAAAGLTLAATSLRNIPMAVILAGPLWGSVLPALHARLGSRARIAAAVVGTAAGLVLGAWVVEGGFYRSLASSARFGLVPYGHCDPRAFVGYLARSPFRGSVFDDPGDGGYLELHAPELRPYGDARFADPVAVREYFGALFDPTRFPALDARHRFDAVLVNLARGEEPLLQLLSLPGWTLAWADLHRAFLVNTATAAGGAAAIAPARWYAGEDLTLRQEGVCANRWTFALVHLDRPDLLLRLLRDLEAAPRIPAPVLTQALEYGVRRGQRAIVAAAAAARPRAVGLRPAELQALDSWLARARSSP